MSDSRWIYALDNLNAGTRLLLLWLWTWGGAGAFVWRSVSQLARDTGQGKRTVETQLRTLTGRGLITRETRGDQRGWVLADPPNTSDANYAHPPNTSDRSPPNTSVRESADPIKPADASAETSGPVRSNQRMGPLKPADPIRVRELKEGEERESANTPDPFQILPRRRGETIAQFNDRRLVRAIEDNCPVGFNPDCKELTWARERIRDGHFTVDEVVRMFYAFFREGGRRKCPPNIMGLADIVRFSNRDIVRKALLGQDKQDNRSSEIDALLAGGQG